MTTITFANFKGGSGKTTNSTMVAYELATMGYKTLLIDYDPQANATKFLMKTYKAIHGEAPDFNNTLMAALQKNKLEEVIMEIKENLFLIPSYRDFKKFPKFLETQYPKDDFARVKYLDNQLKEIKKQYDFIIFDTPPTSTLFTSGALYASDYVVITLQTEERSLDGAEMFIDELNELFDIPGFDIEVLGILPVLFENNNEVDEIILNDAKDIFGDNNMFNAIIRRMKRVKRWDSVGITDDQKDSWDKKTHAVFQDVTKEMIERIKKIEKENN